MARSKRTYPPIKCKNPNCKHEPIFIPHDKRQEYCFPICGSHHQNDLRGEKERILYGEVKLLKKIDKVLAKMYFRLYTEQIRWLHRELLAYEEVDLSLGVKQEMNSETKKQIRWYFCYGLEFHENETHFLIHKRHKNEFSKNTK